MDLCLQDKVIIVTGGEKGIGKSISKLLAAEGAIPFIVSRNEENNYNVADEIKLSGGRAETVAADLTEPAACKDAVDIVLQKFDRINGLINNAGVNDGIDLEHSNYDDFMKSLHHNVAPYYLMAHYALPALIKSKGSIVNICFKTPETGQGNTSAYAASNGAGNALTREWAVELLKYNIRVNAVIVTECYESWINTFPNPHERSEQTTGKIPLKKRLTTTEEIAAAVVFLLSERSSHTTGQLIHTDGVMCI